MEELISRAKTGDADSFIQLMELHKQCLYKTAAAILHNDEDAADAIQETVLSCWQNLSSLKKPQYFKTWMTRILINHCKALLRKRHKEISSDAVNQSSSEQQSYETNLDEKLDVKQTMSALKDNYRLVLTLYYVNDIPIKEIAKLLETNENTIKTRLSRGREQFKSVYNNGKGAFHYG